MDCHSPTFIKTCKQIKKSMGGVMDFLTMIKTIFVNYFQDNMYIAIALAVVFCLLLFRKPKVFLTLIFVTVFLTGVLYLISTLSTTGAFQKQKLVQEEKQLYKDYLH
jgi:chromate transport protein ChrA